MCIAHGLEQDMGSDVDAYKHSRTTQHPQVYPCVSTALSSFQAQPFTSTLLQLHSAILYSDAARETEKMRVTSKVGGSLIDHHELGA